jgi:2-polyprenyl-3-methyl-5-hydroxy-6-metoxy-1,4-benzoquinol methylase
MRELWNQKFSREGLLYGENANDFIKENCIHTKKGGDVLCLGEGEGRNALFLAKEGLHVEALDASDVGLGKLEKRAGENALEIVTHHCLFDEWKNKKLYDCVVCSYMHLAKNEQAYMFKKIINILKTRGYFIAEFFSTEQLNFQSGGPRDINLLYDLCHVKKILSTLECKIFKLSQEIVDLSEGRGHNGEASVIRIIFQKN